MRRLNRAIVVNAFAILISASIQTLTETRELDTEDNNNYILWLGHLLH